LFQAYKQATKRDIGHPGECLPVVNISFELLTILLCCEEGTEVRSVCSLWVCNKLAEIIQI